MAMKEIGYFLFERISKNMSEIFNAYKIACTELDKEQDVGAMYQKRMAKVLTSELKEYLTDEDAEKIDLIEAKITGDKLSKWLSFHQGNANPQSLERPTIQGIFAFCRYFGISLDALLSNPLTADEMDEIVSRTIKVKLLRQTPSIQSGRRGLRNIPGPIFTRTNIIGQQGREFLKNAQNSIFISGVGMDKIRDYQSYPGFFFPAPFLTFGCTKPHI